METIYVETPSHDAANYPVRVGTGLLSDLGRGLDEVCPGRSCAIVTDSSVAPLYLSAVVEALASQNERKVFSVVFEAGEASKNFSTLSLLYDRLLPLGLERSTPVVALGGGVVGDMAGFFAATALRGLPFIQVPTTLLAAVDAGVGGKVGIDHAAGKNLIGAFHQPRLVLTDVSTFASLPPRELRGGLAECVKHAMIRDAALLDFIETKLDLILRRDPETLTRLVAWNVRIKAAVVREDPFEHSVRAHLNFGHTIGHALETAGQYTALRHGEAVALGMVAAARLSHRRGLLDAQSVQRMVRLIERIGLPTSPPAIDMAAVESAMKNDKKTRDGKIRFILCPRIGSAEIFSDVTPAEIRRCLRELSTGSGASGASAESMNV